MFIESDPRQTVLSERNRSKLKNNIQYNAISKLHMYILL
jgi:hypothetical protein